MARGATIIGLAKLHRKLKKLPISAKQEIRAAMAKGADQIVAMMKSLAPVLATPDPRRRPGELRDSIGWTWGKAPKGSFAVATLKGAGIGGELTITIYAGNKDSGWWARWVEFGTSKMSAQPFFYVSWRANRRSTKSRISRAVNKAAKKVAAGG